MPAIHFFAEDTHFKPKNKAGLRIWLKAVINAEQNKLNQLNYIFCSDAYLLQINRDYLKHDTYTDIITFDNSEADKEIKGDIFISVDRIKENATKFDGLFVNELHRVIVHGALHLLGYKDKTKVDKRLMTEMEDKYLALRNF